VEQVQTDSGKQINGYMMLGEQAWKRIIIQLNLISMMGFARFLCVAENSDVKSAFYGKVWNVYLLQPGKFVY
jgi:hypothetical protein